MPDDESMATSASGAELREPCRATAMMSSPVKATAILATTARGARPDGRPANGAIPQRCFCTMAPIVKGRVHQRVRVQYKVEGVFRKETQNEST